MKIERGNVILKLNAREINILTDAKRILDDITDGMDYGDYIGDENTETICDAMDTIMAILDNCEEEGI